MNSYDTIYLNIDNFTIYSFENKLVFPKYNGELIFKFDLKESQKKNDGIIYIYKNLAEICIKNLSFINYEKSIKIYNHSLYYFNPKITHSKYYFVFINQTNIPNKVQIYNPSIPYQIFLDSHSYGYYYGLSYQIFYINSRNFNNEYLHFQFKNRETEILVEIRNLDKILETSNYQYNYSNTFKIINNNEYYIIIKRKNVNELLNYLEFLFYSSDDNKVFPLINRNETKNYPILFGQKMNFYINISRLIENEEEIIKVFQNNSQNEYKVKYFQHDNFDQMINETKEEYLLNKSSCDDFYCLYSFIKINQNDKSALIIANIKDIQLNYNIELLNISKLISREFKKEFLANETGHYYINKDSFKNAKNIIIQSNLENIISINQE